MPKLMLGNKAVARGLYEAGCGFVSSYPGTPSTEITEEATKFDEIYTEWASNEKVAMEAAFGASLAGKRSFCGMKHVGLNVAADPLFTLSYTGINAGMVICVADDPGMHSSQNEQDSRYYAMATSIPMLEPSDSQEALDYTKAAYELSEKYDTPVLVKMCTRVSHTQTMVETGDRVEHKCDFQMDAQKYVMVPAMAKRRHPFVVERREKLSNIADFNKVESGSDNSRGFICDLTSYQYVKEVFGDKHPVLKIGMVYPLAQEQIIDFSKTVDELIVVEELAPFIETKVKAFGIDCIGKGKLPEIDELSQRTVAISLGVDVAKGKAFSEDVPPRPPSLCSGCPHRGLFYVLKKLKTYVFGDIGCYTLGMQAPLGSLHTALCMGASVSGLHGFAKCSDENAVAVIGDSTFIHSGMTGLTDISYNKSNATVIILDNSITGMTGHQNNPANGLNIKGEPAGKVDLEAFVKSIGINRVRVVDPYNLAETEAAIKSEIAVDEPSVIISRRPCVLLKNVKTPGPISVNADKCIGCKSCMRIGCPSITMDDGKAKIDQALCVGCGLCKQMCKVGAFDD
ncbi:MAG: indolepyruvate ferredoxin oxidoreductase subunit alpha [Coriobacteriia bacterium]|nr:indolepyruvate ferredoxin oxidoreductase subunit alpha [Coriobacteriia bacterium]